MKKFAITLAALAYAGAASAGNVDTFVAPVEEPVAVEEPMGGSNASWLVPLLAVAVIAGVAVAASD